jgi:hypothetical protein
MVLKDDLNGDQLCSPHPGGLEGGSSVKIKLYGQPPIVRTNGFVDWLINMGHTVQVVGETPASRIPEVGGESVPVEEYPF